MRSLMWLALLGLAFLATPAAADYGYQNGKRVWYVDSAEALGGDPEDFIWRIRTFRAAGIKVILGPTCLSSCTLYSALLKNGLVCAEAKTVLIFHQYIVPKNLVIQGGIIKSFDIAGTVQELEPLVHNRIMRQYPRHVIREILKRRPAGLPPHGRELEIPAKALGIPTC